MGIYVQYGCGTSSPDGWLNFDVSPTLRLQRLPLIGKLFRRGPVVFPSGVRYGDIIKGLPIPDNTVDGIYASHVLEHLSLDDFGIALANTIRLLKPGGVFRLIVPDLKVRAQRYLAMADRDGADANNWLMRSSGLGMEQRLRGLMAVARSVFGNSGHLWMWDEKSITRALEQAGFGGIRRCKFNDAVDEAFRQVEDYGRFYDSAIEVDECAMEARKPVSSSSG